MRILNKLWVLVVPVLAASLCGCVARDVDFSNIERPPRAPELDAYNVFVGEWDWKAEVVNASESSKQWSGTASWEWTLDKRCLKGSMSAKSADAQFEADGIWSWHPKKKKYVWSMFNNWGYPQEGRAIFCEDCDECGDKWIMKYKSVGLDGTTSYGRYHITVADKNTLDWKLTEWADPHHFFKKMEMKGTYARRK